MDAARLDLNLLPLLLAIHRERSVSNAALHLGISQPAASSGLAKLRDSLDDPLFVRTARGMEATPRAIALIEPAKSALEQIERASTVAVPFEPATTQRCFKLALSDLGEIVFLPRLLERLARDAPNASIRSVTLSPREIEEALESGTTDLAVGYFPDLRRNNYYQQRLFTHHFSCLVRSGHAITSAQLTLPEFLALGHAVVEAEGRSQELFEKFLRRKRLQRRVVLTTPHFMSIPFILARTDLVATVPHAIGLTLARTHAGIRVLLPPMPLPTFDLKQHWHRKYHAEPALQWFRQQIADLFNDEADEWKD